MVIVSLLVVLGLCATSVAQAQLARIECQNAKKNVDQSSCESDECIWDDQHSYSVPRCYLPENVGYRSVQAHSTSSYSIANTSFNKLQNTVYDQLEFRVTHYGATINLEIKPNNKQSPVASGKSQLSHGISSSTEALAIVVHEAPIFAFEIVRTSTGLALWNTTTIGGLVLTDGFVQIATTLPTTNLFEFNNDVSKPLKRNSQEYTKWMIIDGQSQMHKHHRMWPFYLAVENDGKAHGVLIYNNNAQELIIGPAPHLVYRAAGSSTVDITFFPGPTPEDVIEQYTSYVGRSLLPDNGMQFVHSEYVPEGRRVDCNPSPGASDETCRNHGCIWDAETSASSRAPWCYFPSTTGYSVGAMPGGTIELNNVVNGTNPYGTNISPLYFKTTSFSGSVNIRIAPNTSRYEPIIEIPRSAAASSDSLTVHTSSSPMFSFYVIRESSRTAIWDTSIGGLLFADQYIQIATYLPTYRIYGFGEHTHRTLMHNLTDYTTWPMFARDQWPDPNNPTLNLYGVHPFYMAIENDGKAHGVLIFNSNAQEVTLGPAPHLIYRTIGGILDITFFPGPTPEEVIQQYTSYIGKPFLPAYFALGFQLSRYGYKNLTEMETVIAKMRTAKVPLEIVYADIDYMDRYKDFTVGQKWQKLGNYTDQLHHDGLHLFLIFDPAIQINYDAFEQAKKMNASFIEWPATAHVPPEIHYPEYPNGTYNLVNGTQVMIGIVWPDWYVAFPDFFDKLTVAWWIEQFRQFYAKVPLDGIWIDMNEPSVFGTNEEKPWYFNNPDRPVNAKPLWCNLDNKYDKPPYPTYSVYNHGADAHLCSQTVCMNGRTDRGAHNVYDTKNLYGIAETIATNDAHRQVIKKRGAVISRSTFVSSGHYGGHWLGDNSAHWADMQRSVIGIQEFNMFGIPYIGADICGFNGNTTMELCLRWCQLGAFYPFSRNHNTFNARAQDPTEWPAVEVAARQALLFRYHYLPYLYSLHFAASLYGTTVVRPVFFEFPNDANTYELSHQFMWGAAMMIVPVLFEGATSVDAYLPTEATWYSMRPSEYALPVASGRSTFDAATIDLIPVFVRGGSIVPRQKPEVTTRASRLNPFELLIAMQYTERGLGMESNGALWWDDGISYSDDPAASNHYHWVLKFQVTPTGAILTIDATKRATAALAVPTLDIIDIVGYKYYAKLDQLTLNGNPVNVNSSEWSQTATLLRITKSGLINLTAPAVIKLAWPHSAYPPVVKTTTTSIPTVKPTTATIPTLKPTTTTIPTLKPTTTSIPTVKPTTTSIPTLKPTTTSIPTLKSTTTSIPNVKTTTTKGACNLLGQKRPLTVALLTIGAMLALGQFPGYGSCS